MDNESKLYDLMLANEVTSSNDDSWAYRQREVYSGEVLEEELDNLFPIDRLLEQEG